VNTASRLPAGGTIGCSADETTTTIEAINSMQLSSISLGAD